MTTEVVLGRNAGRIGTTIKEEASGRISNTSRRRGRLAHSRDGAFFADKVVSRHVLPTYNARWF